MKKIINNKRYDTEKAKRLAEYSPAGRPRNNYDFYEEALYIKRTGEYFLHGIGGPATRYAKAVGDGWSGGEKIIPLSHDQARQWAEHSLDAEDYEKLFEVEEDEKIIMTISISDSTRDRLKKLAAEKGMPMSAVVEELVLKA